MAFLTWQVKVSRLRILNFQKHSTNCNIYRLPVLQRVSLTFIFPGGDSFRIRIVKILRSTSRETWQVGAVKDTVLRRRQLASSAFQANRLTISKLNFPILTDKSNKNDWNRQFRLTRYCLHHLETWLISHCCQLLARARILIQICLQVF